MSSALFRSSVIDVIREGDLVTGAWQFQCYAEGAVKPLGLETLADINNLPNEILATAQDLINRTEPIDLSTTNLDPRIDYYGLYTFGVYGNATQVAQTAAHQQPIIFILW